MPSAKRPHVATLEAALGNMQVQRAYYAPLRPVGGAVVWGGAWSFPPPEHLKFDRLGE